MFAGFNVTDITGSTNINNDSPFIIVKSNNMHDHLVKITSDNGYSVYRLNYQSLSKLVNKYSAFIDMDNYMSIGDLCSSGEITDVILANKNTIASMNKYKKVGTIGNHTAWVGKATKNGNELRSIGVVLTEKDSPPKFNIPILPINYLVKMHFGGSKIRGNEFNILSYFTDGLWTIVVSKFMDHESYFKYSNTNGKYLSSINSTLSMKDSKDNMQNIRYTSDGQLMIDNKCITVNNGKLILSVRSNTDLNQKWVKKADKFMSLSDSNFNKCLGIDKNNNVVLKNCPKSVEWDFQNVDYIDVRNPKWKSVKGKSLVLVDRNDPWFLNKDIVDVIEHPGNGKISPIGYDLVKDDQTPSRIGGTPKKNRSSFSDGYFDGDQKDKIIETFDDESDSSDNFLLILLSIVLLIVIIIRIRRKRKTS